MGEKTIQDALVNRRSIRNFSSKPVSEETIRDIVKDARWAPSWANAQPWKLYVALGKAAEEIREAYVNGTAVQEGPEMLSFRGENWGRREQHNMSNWGRQLQEFLGAQRYKFGQSQQTVFCQAIFPNFTFRIPSNHRGEFPVFGGIVCDWDGALPS